MSVIYNNKFKLKDLEKKISISDMVIIRQKDRNTYSLVYDFLQSSLFKGKKDNLITLKRTQKPNVFVVYL